jgi:hypothetical protein
VILQRYAREAGQGPVMLDNTKSWLAQCILSDGKNPKPLPILKNALAVCGKTWKLGDDSHF